MKANGLALLLPLCCALAAPAPATEEAYEEEFGKPMLGIQMSPTDGETQEELGLAVDEGVYVNQVYPDTAASDMGLQEGDVIVAVNGNEINGMLDLRNQIGASTVGDPVRVTVRRGDGEHRHEGWLGDWPEHIPYGPVPVDQERRWRDYQMQRFARREALRRSLEEHAEKLRRQVEIAEELRDRRDRALAKRSGEELAAFLRSRPQRELIKALQAGRWGGLDWRFSYRAAADRPQAPSVADDAPADPAGFTFALTADSEAL